MATQLLKMWVIPSTSIYMKTPKQQHYKIMPNQQKMTVNILSFFLSGKTGYESNDTGVQSFVHI